MAATQQTFLGRFAVASGAATFTTQAAAPEPESGSVTAGNYYITGYTGESTSQLCEHLQTQINATNACSSVTVVYSCATGKVTVDNTENEPATIVLSATLANILGFGTTETTLANGVHTATYYPRYTWHPTRGPSDYPLDLTAANFWQPRSTTTIGASEDGTTWSLPGNLLYEAALEYQLLTDYEAKYNASYLHYDFQSFWQDVIHAGQPVRVIPNRPAVAAYTSAQYVPALLGNAEIGSFREYSERYMANYNGLWNVYIPLVKYVTA